MDSKGTIHKKSEETAAPKQMIKQARNDMKKVKRVNSLQSPEGERFAPNPLKITQNMHYLDGWKKGVPGQQVKFTSSHPQSLLL